MPLMPRLLFTAESRESPLGRFALGICFAPGDGLEAQGPYLDPEEMGEVIDRGIPLMRDGL